MYKRQGNAEPDTYSRILSEKERTLTEPSMIETELTNVLGHDISFEVENRVQEKIDNDAMPVSYTHLDVYKRQHLIHRLNVQAEHRAGWQSEQFAQQLFAQSRRLNLDVDVYKRQA